MINEIEIEIDEEVFLPVYRPLLDNDDDIIFLWGGRDSGKTHFIAQRLLMKCMSASYFRCILIRATFATIKDSQFQTLWDLIEDWGLTHLFKRRSNPLEIECINGNKFIARGCDKIEKIKSVKDPTDAWYEEGNQITEEQHITIMTTLRSNKAKVQQWFSFNPECDQDYREFWLYESWTGDRPGLWSGVKTMTVGDESVELRFTSCHTTYNDNPHVSLERKAIHEYLGQRSKYYYTVYTRGLWGNKLVEDQFAHQFDEDIHCSSDVVHDPNKRLFISIDFNISPFAIIFFHNWKDQRGEHVHVFDEMSIENADIDKVIRRIKETYGPWLPSCGLTGDSTGNKKEIGQRDHSSHYKQIKKGLGLKPSQVKTPNNPTHQNSRVDCNYFLLHFPDFKVNKDKCPNLVRDLNFVECKSSGKIIKLNRKEENQRADHLDTFRYLVNTYLKDWIKRHMKFHGYTRKDKVLSGSQMDEGFKKFMDSRSK